MREIWFVLAAMFCLGAASPALAQAPKPAAPAPAPAQPAPAAPANPLAVTADDRVLGKADAPITIIEYGSLTCPHCAAFSVEEMPKLMEKWITPGKVKLVFRPFPRDQVDLHVETVVLCAAPDRFYPFVDTYFASQEQWIAASDYKTALGRIALLGGMSKSTFDSCYDNKAIQDKLLGSARTAREQLGVDSTPTFFINGKKFDGTPTVDGMEAVLNKMAGS